MFLAVTFPHLDVFTATPIFQKEFSQQLIFYHLTFGIKTIKMQCVKIYFVLNTITRSLRSNNAYKLYANILQLMYMRMHDVITIRT